MHMPASSLLVGEGGDRDRRKTCESLLVRYHLLRFGSAWQVFLVSLPGEISRNYFVADFWFQFICSRWVCF